MFTLSLLRFIIEERGADFVDINFIRKQKGFTLMQLAKAVGVSYTTVQLWVSGITEPNEENMEKLKKVLEVVE